MGLDLGGPRQPVRRARATGGHHNHSPRGGAATAGTMVAPSSSGLWEELEGGGGSGVASGKAVPMKAHPNGVASVKGGCSW
jgi:hypothetical protein